MIYEEQVMEDYYPMPMFINLGVTDIDVAVDWYQNTLGFREIFRGPGMVHLRRDRYQDLLLFPTQASDLNSPGEGIVIQFQAGEVSVEEIARKARQQGSSDVDGPLERPWNVREVTVQDPDGYLLRFSEPIDTSLSIDQVMGKK
jgi:catechol 2,3-dioxygenase-like lactoylglutathione lyase family enzyme